MTRLFIVKASEARTSGDFKLNDLAASSGRIDVVCRCAIASILDGKGIRDDTTFIGVLGGKPKPPVSLRFDGAELKTMPFSEIAIAAILKRILGEDWGGSMEQRVPYWKGVYVERKWFADVLRSRVSMGKLYYLHEEGEFLRSVNLDMSSNNVFVLGDQKGLDSGDEKMLDGLSATRISVGPVSYLSSQVITLVHDELDRRMLGTQRRTKHT